MCMWPHPTVLDNWRHKQDHVRFQQERLKQQEVGSQGIRKNDRLRSAKNADYTSWLRKATAKKAWTRESGTERAQFSEVKLQRSDILLKSYTAERIPVLGQLNVHVHYGDQHARLVLLVVAGDGPSLLGRNWLHLNWREIHTGSKTTKLLHQNSALFKDELGKIEQYKATLQYARTPAHDSSSHDQCPLRSNPVL